MYFYFSAIVQNNQNYLFWIQLFILIFEMDIWMLPKTRILWGERTHRSRQEAWWDLRQSCLASARPACCHGRHIDSRLELSLLVYVEMCSFNLVQYRPVSAEGCEEVCLEPANGLDDIDSERKHGGPKTCAGEGGPLLNKISRN